MGGRNRSPMSALDVCHLDSPASMVGSLDERSPVNRFTLSFAVLAASFASAVAFGQPLVDRLPESTMVYVGWSPNAQLQNTQAAKMLADERIMGPWRKLFQEAILSMRDGVEGNQRISDHLPQLIENAMQCEGCFALLDIKQDKRRLVPQLILMVDLGARRPTFETHFKPIHNRMKERLGERVQMMKLEKSWVFFKPDRDGKPSLTWGFVGDQFVMYFGDGAEQYIPRLVKGQIDKPLKSAPAFADAMAKLPGESIFSTWIDTRASLGLAKNLLKHQGGPDIGLLLGKWDKVIEELGAANLKGLAEKTAIQENQFVTRSLLRLDGPAKGLLSFVAQPAVDDAMLKAIPADAMAAMAFRLDVGKFYEQVKTSAANVAGEAGKQAFAEIENGAQTLGLPVKDILSPLGDQWVIYNASSQGGFALTGWTLVAQIREPEKLGRVVNTVRGMLGAGGRTQVRELRVENNVRIEYFSGGGFDMPMKPAWAIVGDKLIVALYPQHVEDAARHIGASGAKSLLDNPDYVAARKRTGDSGAMVYLSGPEVVKNLYPVGLFLVGLADTFGAFRGGDEEGGRAFDITILPSAQRLLQYVGNDCVSIKATPDGVLKTRSVANPLLSPLAWFDSPAIWLTLAVATLDSSQDMGDRVASAGNLRQIGQALQLYASENKQSLPPDLDTLVKKVDLGAEALKSPFGPAKEGPDYAYIHFANMKMDKLDAQVIVAYDKAALEQGEGTNALYADGHVEWHDVDQFKRVLDESKKKALLNNAQP